MLKRKRVLHCKVSAREKDRCSIMNTKWELILCSPGRDCRIEPSICVPFVLSGLNVHAELVINEAVRNKF